MRANNNIEENEKEEDVAKKRRRKLTREQEKAIFAKNVFGTKKGVKRYYRYTDFEYNPNKPFPKNIEIKIPKSSPTFNLKDVDKSIKKLMKELYGK